MRAPSRIRRFVLLATLAAAAIARGRRGVRDRRPRAQRHVRRRSGRLDVDLVVRPALHRDEHRRPGARCERPRLGGGDLHRPAGLLGGLASGTSTWTSPSFTWTHRGPTSAAVSSRARPRSAACWSSAGPRRRAHPAARSHDRDDHDDRERRDRRGGGRRSAPTCSAIDPALLEQGTSYRLLLHHQPRRGRAAQRHPRGLRRHRADGDDHAGRYLRRQPWRPDIPGGLGREARRHGRFGGPGRVAGGRPMAGPRGARLGSSHRAWCVDARPDGHVAGARDPGGQGRAQGDRDWRTSSATRRVMTDDHGYATIRLTGAVVRRSASRCGPARPRRRPGCGRIVGFSWWTNPSRVACLWGVCQAALGQSPCARRTTVGGIPKRAYAVWHRTGNVRWPHQSTDPRVEMSVQ